MENTFVTLNALNVNDHTETKNTGGKDLTYLSWPWAWAEVKKRYPEAHYTIWRNSDGLPYVEDPKTGYMVSTSVTIYGISHEMWLPVMDGANKAMKSTPYEYKVKNPKFRYAKLDQKTGKYFDSYGNEQPEFLIKSVDAASMMDVNKTIMRCLVKNLAMFGLGLYIYAGEDLPEGETQDEPQKPVETAKMPEERIPPKATTTMGNKVPEKTPENPVSNYIRSEMNAMKDRYGAGFNFLKIRSELIKAGTIEDVASEKMTMEQAVSMIEAIYAECEKRKGA